MSAIITPEAISAVLHAAADLVARGWCQKTDAMDDLGFACDPLSTKAVRWDASGAILRAAWELHGETVLSITDARVKDPDNEEWLDVADAAEAEASKWARVWNSYKVKGIVDLNDQPDCHVWRIASALRATADRVMRDARRAT